jgi:WD40 repeat protein
MNPIQDVFISYGRADSKEFAKKLHDQLTASHLNVWFDFENIPPGVDYQKQIDDGIDKADNFLFIISPHAVNSSYCQLEIELALTRNKRIIPILHVEEIDRETWRERHPDSPDHAWETCVLEGKHTSFTNMPSGIRKINWIYFREGVDDYGKSFQILLETIERQRDYVRTHTVLLNQAIAWEKNQKQNQFLLTGKDRQLAEAWLQIQFQDQQAPCLPTDLHCEFITESKKNANNLMTQVFLSHAEEDAEIMEAIRRSLRRYGYTVWTNKTDIQTSEDFQQAIERGIEQADNLVFLVSADSLQSDYCQYEVEYALQLNKRIIPILVRSVAVEALPEPLQDLQYIDLTACFEPLVRSDDQDTTPAIDISQLIKSLNHEASYYERHKILLAKAIKWQRQHQNGSLLLQGYNLRQFEGWFKLAHQRDNHGPTPLQIEFLNASLQQPPDGSVEVFISYSRADSDFARNLNEGLQSQGKTTWFDQESIASGADFQQEIYHGIEQADNFLFIMSPNSVGSPYCGDEVAYAQKLNKRIVTILHRAVDLTDLPSALAAIQWIDFSKEDYFSSFSELIRTLDTDREHVRNHTKWAQQAREWVENGHSQDLLLRGREFTLAEHWLHRAEQEQKYPAPTPQQKAFLQASESAIQATQRREKRQTLILRSLLGLASTVAVIALGSSMLALHNQRKAVQGQVRSLLATAEARYTAGQKLESLLIALEAAQKLQAATAPSDLENEVINALQRPLDSIQEMNTLEGHKNRVADLSFSPDGILATAGEDGTVKLWEKNGAFVGELAHENGVYRLEQSRDGQTLVTLSGDDNGEETHFTVWNREQGQAVLLQNADTPANDGSGGYWDSQLAISPDGRVIATSEGSDRVQLWDKEGNFITAIDPQTYVNHLAFSPDGQVLATAGMDGQVQFWSTSGEAVGDPLVHDDWVSLVRFSPDGRAIVTAADGFVKLWQRDGTLITEIPVSPSRQGADIPLAFSPDSHLLAVLAEDAVATLWTTSGEKIAALEGHEGWVNDIVFRETVDHIATLATAGADGTIKLWQVHDTTDTGWTDTDNVVAPTHTLTGHNDDVVTLQFSPDGQFLASASDDRTVKLWQFSEADSLTKLTPEPDTQFDPYNIHFSPAAKVFTTVSSAGETLLWRTNGKRLKTLGQAGEYGHHEFSPDGQLVVMMTGGQTQLFSANGRLLSTLAASDSVEVVFSPDSQYVAVAEYNGAAHLWKTDGSAQAEHLLMENVADEVLIVFSPDSTRVAISEKNHPVKLWDVNGQALADLAAQSESWVTDLVFSPDSQHIITLMNSWGDNTEHYGPVELWHREGTHRGELIGQTDIPSLTSSWSHKEVQFTADSTAFLSTLHTNNASSDLYLWTRQERGQFEPQILLPSNEHFVTLHIPRHHESQGLTVPNVFITVQERGPIQLWRTDGKRLATLTEDHTGYPQVHFSPDGTLAALIHRDRLQLWDTQGRLIHEFDYSADFGQMSFSHDSQLLAVSAADNTIKLWNRKSPRSLTSLSGHTAQPEFLQFSQDGNQLLSASTQEIFVRQLHELANLDALIASACQQAEAYLITHPQTLDTLEICHREKALLAAAATAWERRGQDLARRGQRQAAIAAFRKAADWRRLDLDPATKYRHIQLLEEAEAFAIANDVEAATDRFAQALKLNPSLDLDPATEARQIAAQTLIHEGKQLIENNDLDGAIAKFQAAVARDSNLDLDPELEAKQIKANLLLQKSENLIYSMNADSVATAVQLYEEAHALVPEITTEDESFLFSLCWYGNIFGLAETVLPICEETVANHPEDKTHYANRGLAKGLTGARAEALADFQTFIDWAETHADDYSTTDVLPTIRQWMATLEAGQDPFTPEELEKLQAW